MRDDDYQIQIFPLCMGDAMWATRKDSRNIYIDLLLVFCVYMLFLFINHFLTVFTWQTSGRVVHTQKSIECCRCHTIYTNSIASISQSTALQPQSAGEFISSRLRIHVLLQKRFNLPGIYLVFGRQTSLVMLKISYNNLNFGSASVFYYLRRNWNRTV